MPLADFRPMYLSIDERGDIVVVTISVRQLSDDVNIDQLGAEMFALVEQFGCRKLIVSLSVVEYVTSAALGKLITLHRKLHRNQGALVLCGLRESVNGVFLTANLLDYFEIVADIETAIEQLSSGPSNS